MPGKEKLTEEGVAGRPTTHHDIATLLRDPEEAARLKKEKFLMFQGFKFRSRTTHGPFVTLNQLTDHLRLVNAFAKLRESVQNACEIPPSAPAYTEEQGMAPAAPSADDPAERCWTNYLTRASYRFEAWFAQIVTSQNLGKIPAKVNLKALEPTMGYIEDTSIEVPDLYLPPLDVALLWHAYLLNPLRAYEDAFRLPSRQWLLALRFPLDKLAKRLDSGVYTPPIEARQFWEQTIDQPYESPLSPPPAVPADNGHATSLNGLMMSCPQCAVQSYIPFTATNWPYRVSSQDSRGLSDDGWLRTCSTCNQKIDKDTLQGRRLINDLQQWAADTTYCIAADLVNPADGKRFRMSPADAFLCPGLKHITRPETTRLLRRRIPLATTTVQEVASASKYSASAIAKQCENLLIAAQTSTIQRNALFRNRVQRRARLLFSPILDSGVIGESTLDLVTAAKRQQSFCAEMARLGWSDPARLSAGQDDASLARGLVRYHKWLELLSTKPTLLCPTLDIDLCWHTHQLTPHYVPEMCGFIGRFIDHDDKIEEGVLSNAFQKTAYLWQSKFNQPYSQCGCVHNTPGVVKTISRVLGGDGSLSNRLKASRVRPGDLKEDDFEEATHPSAHSAVAIPSHADALERSKQRTLKSERRAAEGRRRNGHPDPFIAGYGYTPLYPFYVPCVVAGAGIGTASCVTASCGSSLGGMSGACGSGGMAGCGGPSGAICGGGAAMSGSACAGGGGGGCAGGGGGGGGCGGGGGGGGGGCGGGGGGGGC